MSCSIIEEIEDKKAESTMAGMLATISHLQENPADFLKNQNTPHWIVRYQNQ